MATEEAQRPSSLPTNTPRELAIYHEAVLLKDQQNKNRKRRRELMTALSATSRELEDLEETVCEKLAPLVKKMKLVEQAFEQKAIGFESVASKNEDLEYSNKVLEMETAKLQEEKIALEKEKDDLKKQVAKLTEEVDVLKHNLFQTGDKLSTAEKLVERYKLKVKQIGDL
jgi:chromosome segregation ATPase